MKWKCKLCRCVVESKKKPSSRYETTITVAVPGEVNSFQGVSNPRTQSSASHHGPICFGNERGEDFYQHEWIKVKE